MKKLYSSLLLCFCFLFVFSNKLSAKTSEEELSQLRKFRNYTPIRIETTLAEINNRLQESSVQNQLKNNKDLAVYFYITDSSLSSDDVSKLKINIQNPYILDFSGVGKYAGNNFNLWNFTQYLREVHFPKGNYNISVGDCGELLTVYVPKELTHSGSFRKSRSLEEFITEKDSLLTRIDSSCFSNCEHLKKVSLQTKQPVSIGEDAFYYCKELKEFDFSNISNIEYQGFMYVGLEKVEFGENTFLKNYAFYCCENLREISFKNNKAQKSFPLFFQCDNIQQITLNKVMESLSFNSSFTKLNNINLNGNSNFVIEKGILYSKDKSEIFLILPEYSNEDFEFPPTVTKVQNPIFAINNKIRVVKNACAPEKEISYAYNYMTNVEEVYFNDSTEVIGDFAFKESLKLRKVVAGKSLKKIRRDAFFKCESLEDLVLPDDAIFEGESHFVGCKNLKKFVFPKNTKIVPYDIFYECTSLQEVVIPEGVTVIGGKAFYNCSSLTSVHLPDTVNVICSDAFKKCTALKDINMPQSLKKIEGSAFSECTSLERLVIPEGTKELKSCFVENCTNLKTVSLPWTLENLEMDFTTLEKLNTVYFDGSAEYFALLIKNMYQYSEYDKSRNTNENKKTVMVSCSNGKYDITKIADEVKSTAQYKSISFPKLCNKSFEDLVDMMEDEYNNGNYLKACYFYYNAIFNFTSKKINDSSKYITVINQIISGNPGFAPKNEEEAYEGWLTLYKNLDEIFLDNFQFWFTISDSFELNIRNKKDLSQNPPVVNFNQSSAPAWYIIKNAVYDGMKTDNYQNLYNHFNLQSFGFLEGRYSFSHNNIDYTVTALGNQPLNSLYNNPQNYRVNVNSIKISFLNCNGLIENYSVGGQDVPVYKYAETQSDEFQKYIYPNNYIKAAYNLQKRLSQFDDTDYSKYFPQFTFIKGEINEVLKFNRPLFNIEYRPSLYVLPVTQEIWDEYTNIIFEQVQQDDYRLDMFAKNYYCSQNYEPQYFLLGTKLDKYFYNIFNVRNYVPKTSNKYNVKSFLYDYYKNTNSDALFYIYFTQEDFDTKNGIFPTETYLNEYLETAFEKVTGGTIDALCLGYKKGYGLKEDYKEKKKNTQKITVKDFYVLKDDEFNDANWITISLNVPVFYRALALCNMYSEKYGFEKCYSINGSYDIKDWPCLFDKEDFSTQKQSQLKEVYNSATVYWNPKANGFRLPTIDEAIYLSNKGYTKNGRYSWGKIESGKTSFDFTIKNFDEYVGKGISNYEIIKPEVNFGKKAPYVYQYYDSSFKSYFKVVRSTPEAIEFYVKKEKSGN